MHGSDRFPVPGLPSHRRGSFLYKTSSDVDVSSKSLSRNSSLVSDQLLDDQIVTPFAQILQKLRSVQINCQAISVNFNTNRRKSEPTSSSIQNQNGEVKLTEDDVERLTKEVLHELTWCLDHLESVQNHKSAGDMATIKFKRLLSRELSVFAESNSDANQITQFITNNYLDKEMILDMQSLKRMSVTSTTCPDQVSPTSASCSQMRTSYSSDLNSQSNSNPTPHQYSPTNPDQSPVSTSIRPVSHPPAGSHTDASFNPEGNSERVSVDPCRGGSGLEQELGRMDVIPGIKSLSQSTLQEYFSFVDERHKADIDQFMEVELDLWGVDIFRMNEYCNFKPLTLVGFTIFKKRNLLEKFKIPADKLVRYLTHLEEHYHKDVPFHNSLHATDVLQSVHALLNIPILENIFSSLEVLAAVLGAAVHDVDHPGYTNQFLINSQSELALMHNDESVLENHHLAVAFKLLQDQDCDILLNLADVSRKTLRKMIIDIVLATDMNKHLDHIAALRTMTETRRLSGSSIMDLDNYSERIQILQSLVHCADLSNPTKPLPIYQRWNSLVMREFYRQGDLEKELGMEVSPMCDRDNSTLERIQVSFIDYVVQPLWEAWSDLVHPYCQPILDALEDNRQWYKALLREDNNKTDAVSESHPIRPVQLINLSHCRPLTSAPQPNTNGSSTSRPGLLRHQSSLSSYTPDLEPQIEEES